MSTVVNGLSLALEDLVVFLLEISQVLSYIIDIIVQERIIYLFYT